MSERARRWRLPAGWMTPAELAVGLALLAVLGPALWFASPWLLPVRVVEGPLIQNAGEDEFTLVWFTTRAVASRVTVSTAEGGRSIPALTDGRRNSAVIDGLQPGQSYAYRLEADGHAIPDASGVAKTSAGTDVVRFVVFGDSGKGYRDQYRLAARMEESEPDFLVHTGDLIYGSGERRYFKDRFFAPYRRLLRSVPFWPSLGNHDVRENGGIAYREVFTLPENGPTGQPPENNYWFDAGPARVAIFDSNLKEDVLREVIAPWLREVLSAPGPMWRCVVCHHPPFASGRYPQDLRLQRSIGPVLEESGVDILFNGHDHNYQRSHPLRGGEVVAPGAGVVYVVSGAGGANLYELKPQMPAFAAVRNAEVNSFTEVELRGALLRARQIAVDGRVLDEFTIEHRAAATAPVQP